MPRKRIELTHAQKAEIAARTARGESAATICSAMGLDVSPSTIERRQRELKKGHSDGRRASVSKRHATPRDAGREPPAAEASGEDPDTERAIDLADELGVILDRMIERALREDRNRLLEVFRQADAERATWPPCPTCGVRSKPAGR